mmetsp:Transcript_33928/g.72341  ORF Transcript_33928/g.72341 Transcript_33928/m.72341 type:complete len:215 (+) Transcript_33928:322-966(+)
MAGVGRLPAHGILVRGRQDEPLPGQDRAGVRHHHLQQHRGPHPPSRGGDAGQHGRAESPGSVQHVRDGQGNAHLRPSPHRPTGRPRGTNGGSQALEGLHASRRRRRQARCRPVRPRKRTRQPAAAHAAGGEGGEAGRGVADGRGDARGRRAFHSGRVSAHHRHGGGGRRCRLRPFHPPDVQHRHARVGFGLPEREGGGAEARRDEGYSRASTFA